MIRVGRLPNKAHSFLKVPKYCKNWSKFYIDFLIAKFFKQSNLLRDNDLSIYIMRDGNKLAFRTCDSVMLLWEIFFKQAYFRYGNVINKNDIVIDIGANIGVFSILAATLGAVWIYSYEPSPDEFRWFNYNVNLNDLDDIIKTFNLAVGARKGKAELSIDMNNPGGHHLRRVDELPKRSLSVECVTLKDIFKTNRIEKCDFLKMDCEGSEYDILLSSDECLGRTGKISLEYHDNVTQYSHEDLKYHLQDMGFIVNVVKNSSSRHMCGMLYARRRKFDKKGR